MEASPSKRRALGSLDPNASSPKPQLGFKQLKPVALNAPGSPLKRSAEPTCEPEPKKRQLTMEPKTEHQPSRKPSIDEKGQQVCFPSAKAPPPLRRLTWNTPSPPCRLIDTDPRHRLRLRCSTRPGSTTPKGPRSPNRTSTRLFLQRLDINKHPMAACLDH